MPHGLRMAPSDVMYKMRAFHPGQYLYTLPNVSYES